MKNKKLFAILTLICFALTMMPVAAFAAPAVADQSVFAATNGDQSVKVGNAVNFEYYGVASDGSVADTTTASLYVWVTNASGTKISGYSVEGGDTTGAPLYVNKVAVNGNATIKVTFSKAGVYKVNAALCDAASPSQSDLNALKLDGSGTDTITVIDTTDPETTYYMTVGSGTPGTYLANFSIGSITPNNVANEITLTFEQKSTNAAGTEVNKALSGKTVYFDTNSSNIKINKTSASTNGAGIVKLNVSASRDGEYKIYATIDGVEFIINVAVGSNDATYIETVTQPSAPIALYTSNAEFTDSAARYGQPEVKFSVTDINGNAVAGIMTGAKGGASHLLSTSADKAKYLYFVEKPATSGLTNGNLDLHDKDDGTYVLTIGGNLDAEGTYTVKVILDNGSNATATWTVKKFQTPVSMYFSAGVPNQVELGRVIRPTVKYVDANGVTKKATDVTLSATGYAIQKTEDDCAKITLKTDEKYIGSTITVTAVSDRYNLVCSKDVKIAEAVKITFASKTLAVNANNTIAWDVTDADGNVVKVNGLAADAKVSYVVLDKPAGAKVSVVDDTTTNAAGFNGNGKMKVTTDTVGNVTIQAICQVTLSANSTGTTNQTKYYTGTQIFACGTESTGKVVVMSIGSNGIIVNDKVSTVDAAPIVQNSRTYVPFRALGEAFGAKVSYDEATQSVTAELNGTTVVMTIGSATYTVNGVAKTMDVAPFISNSRTYVPVRFAAEAFGIKVIPTYDENGATADILFNL